MKTFLREFSGVSAVMAIIASIKTIVRFCGTVTGDGNQQQRMATGRKRRPERAISVFVAGLTAIRQ
jgi:hypothetical protein